MLVNDPWKEVREGLCVLIVSIGVKVNSHVMLAKLKLELVVAKYTGKVL